MTEDSTLIKKRFVELARRAYNTGTFTFTDFLGLGEQSLFSEVTRDISGVHYELFGGADGAERVMVRFGDPEELGYSVPYPIVTIKAEPKNQKFADRLTHRDFLGSLMNLGIERETLGDIVIINNVGYIFAKEEITEYIISSLTKVKHTDVTLTVADALPEGELYKTEGRKIQVSSERLDAVVAKVFSLSRDDAQSLFKKGLVFASGRCIESVSHTPKPEEKISVRGHGRFIYKGCSSLSKKGKLNIDLEIYI